MAVAFRRHLGVLLIAALVLSLALVPITLGGHASDGKDVKVTRDNNNKDGGTPTPSLDAKNRQSNETTVAISPTNPNIVVAAANDYRMVPVFGDAWVGVYVSSDGGKTWFNTMVPGFPSDTSLAGQLSPLRGLDGAGDPTVRFDAAGNLFVAGIAFNRNFDQEDLSNDTVVFVARYRFFPGSPAGVSTPNAAANPPNFVYEFTTVVDRGAVGFAVPEGDPFGFAGKFDDKNWMAIDTHPGSPCAGNIYYTFTRFTGLAGAFPIVFSRSLDGGATFSEPKPVSTSGQEGTVSTQGSNIGVATDGTVFVSYRTFATPSDPVRRLQVVRSTDCGKSFGKPVTAAIFTPMPRNAAGLAFRTPTNSWIATDDTNANVVYVAFMAMAGSGSAANADIFVARSTDQGATWEASVTVNDDATNKHQFWPTIAVSNGALHVGWYDFRNSANPADPASGNDVLNVNYASVAGGNYPNFSHNVKITDVGHNPNCRMFGGGTSAFHGDYIELAARFNGKDHVVHIAWADNRNVSPCDTDPAPGSPGGLSTGNRNQNIYADKLVVAP